MEMDLRGARTSKAVHGRPLPPFLHGRYATGTQRAPRALPVIYAMCGVTSLCVAYCHRERRALA
jgi:hypothetical protein